MADVWAWTTAARRRKAAQIRLVSEKVRGMIGYSTVLSEAGDVHSKDHKRARCGSEEAGRGQQTR